MTPALTSVCNLMKGLTRAQKRDFKKFSRFHDEAGEQKYRLLFDLLNDYLQSKKDLGKLPAYLAAHPKFGSTAIVNAQAAYLFDRLVQSMRNMPDAGERLSSLYGLLQEVVLLFNKGLFQECYVRIQRGLRLADQLNRHTLQLEFLMWERRVFNVLHGGMQDIRLYMDQFRAQTLLVSANLATELDYIVLGTQINLRLREAQPLSEELRNLVQEKLLWAQPMRAGDSPFLTKIWYLHSLVNYYELQGVLSGKQDGAASDQYPEQVRHCLEQILDLFHNTPNVIREDDPFFYNAFLENYLNLCARLGRLEDILRVASYFQIQNQELYLVRSVAFSQLQYYLSSSMFREASRFIREFELVKKIGQFSHQIPDSRKASLYFSCGQTFFLCEEYERAQEAFEPLTNRSRAESVQLTILLAELLMAISQFQQGRRYPLALLQPLARKIKKFPAIEGLLKDLLTGMRLVFQERTGELAPVIEQLHRRLEQQPTLGLFANAVAWIEARANGTSVIEEISKYNS